MIFPLRFQKQQNEHRRTDLDCCWVESDEKLVGSAKSFWSLQKCPTECSHAPVALTSFIAWKCPNRKGKSGRLGSSGSTCSQTTLEEAFDRSSERLSIRCSEIKFEIYRNLQDIGSPPHFALAARQWIDKVLLLRCSGQRGPSG